MVICLNQASIQPHKVRNFITSNRHQQE
uniref:Uncharacterized protein n=1 Tax=Rhizophora mucronata TaxID=61149 RepID=A0A2P2NL43_RHIMU